jgi:hypothetical protein
MGCCWSSAPDGSGRQPQQPTPFGLSTIDSTLRIDTRNNDQNQNSIEARESIILPSSSAFTCSANGRNGWLVDEVYDIGDSVRYSVT